MTKSLCLLLSFFLLGSSFALDPSTGEEAAVGSVAKVQLPSEDLADELVDGFEEDQTENKAENQTENEEGMTEVPLPEEDSSEDQLAADEREEGQIEREQPIVNLEQLAEDELPISSDTREDPTLLENTEEEIAELELENKAVPLMESIPTPESFGVQNPDQGRDTSDYGRQYQMNEENSDSPTLELSAENPNPGEAISDRPEEGLLVSDGSESFLEESLSLAEDAPVKSAPRVQLSARYLGLLGQIGFDIRVFDQVSLGLFYGKFQGRLSGSDKDGIISELDHLNLQTTFFFNAEKQAFRSGWQLRLGLHANQQRDNEFVDRIEVDGKKVIGPGETVVGALLGVGHGWYGDHLGFSIGAEYLSLGALKTFIPMVLSLSVTF